MAKSGVCFLASLPTPSLYQKPLLNASDLFGVVHQHKHAEQLGATPQALRKHSASTPRVTPELLEELLGVLGGVTPELLGKLLQAEYTRAHIYIV